jgi:fucose permease
MLSFASITHVQRLLVILSACAFVSLGLPDGLLGVAWPSMRLTFARDLDALGLLLVAATAGYIASSATSGRMLRHMNLGGVLALSCLLTALALVGYAVSPDWRLLVALAAVLGVGGGGIDAALNTYAATHHGPRVLNGLHACYGIGAALGPLIMTAVLSRDLPWQLGYAIVGAAQLLLAAAFGATRPLWPRTTRSNIDAARAEVADVPARLGETLALPGARLAALTFVVYAGVEASLGAWTYTLLTAARGLPPSEAGAIVSVYWGGLTAGRVLAASAGGGLPPRRLLGISMAGVFAGTLVIWLGTGAIAALIGIAVAGCACGPIFPTLVATTPSRLGAHHTANAVGLQIAAAGLGLSIVPALVGIMADSFGVPVIAPLVVTLAVLLLAVFRLLERQVPPR